MLKSTFFLKKTANIFFIFFILSLKSFAFQQELIQLEGTIIDKKTSKPIPFCTIRIDGTYVGTSTNELGEFVLNVKKTPVILSFAHLSYEEKKIIVSEKRKFKIELLPMLNVLEEVKITKIKKDYYAIGLVKKAYNKLKKDSKIEKYGKAHYRQKSTNNEKYNELSEIIFDCKYSTSGVEDWDIIEGRYALKKEAVNNKNYTLFSKIIKSNQPNTDDIIFLLHPQFEYFYNVRLVEKIKSKKGEIAVIKFSPKVKGIPIFKGEVYIDIQTKNILKIEANIFNDELKLVKLKEEGASKKNYSLSYEMSFKQDPKLGLIIDYLKINQDFDYYLNEIKKTHVSSNSSLTFFEYYTPTSRNKLGKQFKRNQSDWEKLNELEYNKFFWDNNPIVKRTPIELEVIEAFEKDNAFESIFINSRNQISFSQEDVLNDPFVKELSIEINDYNKQNPIEKIYLHTNKDVYKVGEELWFSVYSSLAYNKNNLVASELIYIDLINEENKIINSQSISVFEGRSKGSVKIPIKGRSGEYRLRAYSNWMKNFDTDYFFNKNIKVLGRSNRNLEAKRNKGKIDLNFFPEGGYLIADLPVRIAFKAISTEGEPVKIKGKVFDSADQYIVSVNSLEKGMGSFTLKPKKGDSYYVKLSDGWRYKLPNVVSEGYSMLVNNLSDKSVQVRVQASEKLRNKSFYLIAQIENRKVYQGKFEFGGKLIANVEVPKSKLPTGVMTLTIFDSKKQPRSERIVYVNNKQELFVTVKEINKKTKKNGKISLDVKITDIKGKPVKTSLSVVVTDIDKYKKNEYESNILTYFLLESQTKGDIKNPMFLINDVKRSTKFKLDLVMRTNGWRRIKWNELNQKSKIKQYSFTSGISLSGLATRYNLPVKNKKIDMVAVSKDKIWTYSTKTDSIGKFKIENISQSDSIKVAFNLYEKGVILKDLKIKLDKKNNYKSSPTNKKSEYVGKKNNFHNETFDEKTVSSLSKGDIVLEEVQIKARNKREVRKKGTPSLYSINADNTVYADDRMGAANIFDLLSGIPGVGVSENKIVIRQGRSAPLYILDGMAIPGSFAAPLGVQPESGALIQPQSDYSVPSMVAQMSSLDIERIEVLKGPNAAMFGLRGANGVILIYSKTTIINKLKIKVPEFIIRGNTTAKEFYSPKYALKNKKGKNKKATIYWNPNVLTDDKGSAKIEFDNNNVKNLQIIIEGLSIYGTPGVSIVNLIR